MLYRPEFCGQPELEFFGRAVLGKTAIFQVGEWTCDSEARPLKTAQGLGEKVRRCPDDESCATAVKTWLGDASVQRVTGWDRKNLTHPLPPVDGLACLTAYCPENHGHAVMRLAGSNSGTFRLGAFGSEPRLQVETPRIQGG